MKPTMTGRHSLEIRVLDRVVVHKEFESKPGNAIHVFKNRFKHFTAETFNYYFEINYILILNGARQFDFR